jgi:AraC family L-rhamnose operon transcriptional activator RhaR/AraC family L-rhamnose operon regulatory protein RhaS
MQYEQEEHVLHCHGFDELVFVLKGSGVHVVDNDEYPLIRGDAFVVRNFHAHMFDHPKYLVLANIIYQWDFFHELEKEFADNIGFKALFETEPRYRKEHQFKARLRLTPQQLDTILPLIKLMDEETHEKRYDYKSAVEHIFKLILIQVCRYYTETTTPRSIGLVKISSAIDYMEKNYPEEISVDSLANKANMASSSFRRIFKQTTGLTPTDFLIHLRIEKAAEMILQKGVKITDASLASGFWNSSYFTRKFKKIMGMTPVEYRKKHAGSS